MNTIVREIRFVSFIHASEQGDRGMIKAKDIMTKELITVSPKTEITKAAGILLEKGINGVPVVDSGRLVGILCQSDLIAQQKNLPIPSVFAFLDGFIPLRSAKHFEKALKKIAATTVADSMTPDPVTVQPEASIEEIASLMVDKNLHTLPVVEGGKLVGIIGKEDVLKTLISSGGDAAGG
jgi:CBS domain-containing protein